MEFIAETTELHNDFNAYVKALFTLCIEIQSVNDLAELSRGHLPIHRSYVSCRLLDNNEEKDVHRTEEADGEASIQFPTNKFSFTIFHPHNVIQFKIWIRRHLHKNILLGEVRIPVSQLISECELSFGHRTSITARLTSPKIPDDRCVSHVSGTLLASFAPKRRKIVTTIKALALRGKKYFIVHITWEIRDLKVYHNCFHRWLLRI